MARLGHANHTPWPAVVIAVAILLVVAAALPFVRIGIEKIETRRALRDLRARAGSVDPTQRVTALAALAALRDPPPEVITDLTALAVGEEPPEVRRLALAGLQSAARNQELPGAIWEELVAELDQDPTPEVVAALLTALGSTESSVAAALPRQTRWVELAVRHSDSTVRDAAIGLLTGFAWQGHLSAEAEAGLVDVLTEQSLPGAADTGLGQRAAAALRGAAEHRPLTASARAALYNTATGDRAADRAMALETLEQDRQRNAPGGYDQPEIEAFLIATRAEREETTREGLERASRAPRTPEPTRLERLVGRERVGGNLYLVAICISGLLCAGWLVVYLARVVALAGARSWKAVWGLLAIGLWIPISVGTGYLFFLGFFLFGHNSTPPPSRQLQLAAAALFLAAIYGAVGWGLNRLLTRR